MQETTTKTGSNSCKFIVLVLNMLNSFRVVILLGLLIALLLLFLDTIMKFFNAIVITIILDDLLY